MKPNGTSRTRGYFPLILWYSTWLTWVASVCVCVREAKRKMDVNMEKTRQILNRFCNIILSL